MKNVLAIIPARGGSKGIIGKNLKTISGKSLVGWSVHHALNSKTITRVIVSTDSEEIKKEALLAGAEVPFMRPVELAEDHVLDFPVFEHTLNWLKETEGYEADVVVHLRPTAPYRKQGWIDECVKLLDSNISADSVRSVSAVSQHPYRVFRIDETGYLDPVMKHECDMPYLLRRQDLPDMYFYNCVIDVTKPDTLNSQKSMTGKKILPYVMDPDLVFDIDTPKDFKVAEILIKEIL